MANTKSVGQVFHQKGNIRTYKEDFYWVLPDTMVGVEIEVEGARDIITGKSGLWEKVHDGSLRQVKEADPYELRFLEPLCGYDLSTALNIFERGLRTLKEPPVWSARTSVHVHLNMIEMSLEQLLSFIIYYTVFEKSLFRYAGKERENNTYCLPYYKAEGVLFEALSIDSITNPTAIYTISNENYRYAALNLAALKKFGTVEFRHMGGTSDVHKIRNWINIIFCLKKYSLINTTLDLTEIPQFFSAKGMKNCAEEVFGKYLSLLDYPEFNIDMLNGIRLAQDIIYRSNLVESSTKLKQSGTNFSSRIKKYAENKHINLSPVEQVNTPQKTKRKPSTAGEIIIEEAREFTEFNINDPNNFVAQGARETRLNLEDNDEEDGN